MERAEALWSIFRMQEIGKGGLSIMKVRELKILLEEEGDGGKLSAINNALNNYKIRVNKSNETKQINNSINIHDESTNKTSINSINI